MLIFFIALALSFGATLLVVRYSHLHSHITADHDLNGVQKFHVSPVPRVGGICLVIGLTFAVGFDHFQKQFMSDIGLLLLLSAIPAFGIGFIEDLTKRVGVKVRLAASFVSAALAGYFLGAWLSSLQIFGIDDLMGAYPWLAIAITCFAVAGVANAFNIIDGYNGLAGVVGIAILSGIGFVAFKLHDFEIMIAAFVLVGAIMGFLVFNYPRGLIFLGDGGAYLIGFWVAELSVLLTARHPEVSKWFPFLLCLYPIFETIFTIYRRVIVKKSNPGKPDASHLHQLIYMRVVRWKVGANDVLSVTQRNALTAPYLWSLSLLSVIPAVLFWQHHIIMKIFTVLFVTVYIYIYRSIVRFNVPDWICIRNDC